MKRYIIIGILVILYGCSDKVSVIHTEQTVTLTREQFMVIYKVGYFEGVKAAYLDVLDKKSGQNEFSWRN